MDALTISYVIPFWVKMILLPLIIWEVIWKGVALWKCGRNNQLIWFIFILILNTAGLLPILYLLFFQKKTFVQRIKKQVRKVGKIVKRKE